MVSTMIKKVLNITAVLLFLSISPSVASDPFPEYDIVKPNVNFWEQVYTMYNTRQGIVHDCIQPHIIYEVIKLEPPDAHGSYQTNKKRMRQVKKYYKTILRHLAANPNIKNKKYQKVAKLFGPDATAKTYRKASYRIRCQVGQRDRFASGITRSGAYIDQIREIFKSYGIPEDLAYLPHVESSFNYKAYSKSGAAGIWQFTRSTGKRYMTIGYELDERRDPIIASHAAAKLLKRNYEKLGSWPLAISAYNHGATGMKRAKRRHGNYPAIFKSYRSRTFKFASRNFYSEFLAARKIAANYIAYFGPLELNRPQLTYTVKLNGYAKFEDLSNHFKVPPDRLRALNLALRKPVYGGQKYVPKGYELRLPGLQQGPSLLVARIPMSLYQTDQKASSFHTVRRGETVAKIARIYGVKPRELILANNLNRQGVIHPRQTLRIPRKVKEDISVKKARVAATLSKLPEAEPDKFEYISNKVNRKIPDINAMTVAVDIRKTKTRNGRTIGVIQVEVEETLGHYAEWAETSTRQIRRLNNIANGKPLHLHQKLKIPLNRVSAEKFRQNRYEYHRRMQDDFFEVYRISGLKHYRTKRGDSYWELCSNKFDIPMWLMKRCNPEVDFGSLHANKRLMVPIVEKNSALLKSGDA